MSKSNMAEMRTVRDSKGTKLGRFVPGVMASQIWPTSPSRPGATADAMRYILDDGFFAAVQTVHVPEPSERRAIRALVEASEVTYTYTLTRLQSQKQILLGSLDTGSGKLVAGSVEPPGPEGCAVLVDLQEERVSAGAE